MANNQYTNRVDVRRGNATETLIDITDTTAVAADVAQGKYFYLASGEKVAGTNSGGGSDTRMIVTMSYDETSQLWVPDKTYAELYAAYSADKKIYWLVDDESGEAFAASGIYNHYANQFEVNIWSYFENLVDEDHINEGVCTHLYHIDSNNIVTDVEEGDFFYATYSADAMPSNVTVGKVFFNADGIQVGTA